MKHLRNTAESGAVEKNRSVAVRRYLALARARQTVSALKLQFAYDWSNPNMPAETLIRKVVDKGRFHDLAVICKRYGLERVRELAGDQIAASPALQRSFANIERGFARAREQHPA
ncbi:hypothetical protein [Pseudothauera nasutitermitis]|uniref:hypothetical protein n=1 Tax=Pseudothauera nasutitermitis TaxID=2565930 RepID=UPI001454CE05|nr:hypothetical protein [Pseudothauera nasutitermitis]